MSWIAFYDDHRLHQAHGYRTPMAVWRERMRAAKAVADRVCGSVIERDQVQSVFN